MEQLPTDLAEALRVLGHAVTELGDSHAGTLLLIILLIKFCGPFFLSTLTKVLGAIVTLRMASKWRAFASDLSKTTFQPGSPSKSMAGAGMFIIAVIIAMGGAITLFK